MNNKLNRVPLKELNLTDRFLFDEVMEDSQVHRDVLSIIFGREIPLLARNETEKKLTKGKSVEEIADDLEESIESIKELMKEME